MLKLRQIASNMTEITSANGADILFSYSTPVAGRLSDGTAFKTDKWYSQTTTRHINKYFKGLDPSLIVEYSQDYIDAMV